MIKYFIHRIWDDLRDLPEEILGILSLVFTVLLVWVNYHMIEWLFGVDDPFMISMLIIIPELLMIPFIGYLHDIYSDYKNDKDDNYIEEVYNNGRKWKN